MRKVLITLSSVLIMVLGFQSTVFAETKCRVYNSNSEVKLVQKLVESYNGSIKINLKLDQLNSQRTVVRVCIWDLDDSKSAGCKTCYIQPAFKDSETIVYGLESGHTYELSIDTASCD